MATLNKHGENSNWQGVRAQCVSRGMPADLDNAAMQQWLLDSGDSPNRQACVAQGMPATFSDAEMKIWHSVYNTVRAAAEQANDWVERDIARMRGYAKTMIDTQDRLENLLDSFNDRGGFEQITADDGTEFVDVVDFCARELGLSREFVQQYMVDDESR